MKCTKLLFSRIKACFIAFVGTRFFYFISFQWIFSKFRTLLSKDSSVVELIQARTSIHLYLTYFAAFVLLFSFGYAVHCNLKLNRQYRLIDKSIQESDSPLKHENLIFEDLNLFDVDSVKFE